MTAVARLVRNSVVGATLALVVAGTLHAQTDGATSAKVSPLSADLKRDVGKAFDAGIAYYRTVQEPNGAFGPDRVRTGVTALAVTSLLRTGRVKVDDPLIAKALKYIENDIQPDGGIYPKGSRQKNYNTSVALLALVEANKDGRYKKQIADATKFLKTEQWLTGKASSSDYQYGGWGYDSKGRPDLSNTSLTLEALHTAGLPADDEAYKAAVTFLRRTQNYRGEGGNDMSLGTDADMDGGHYYTVVESKADPKSTTKRPSYGSMTYAGLKSYIYAGVAKDDPRVQAATKWIQNNYSVEVNPGIGNKGLYYYYHTFAKTFRTLGVDKVTDAGGTAHDWRADLIKALVSRQKKDGSWINSDKTWLESEGQLSTAFALLALAHAAAD